MPSGPYQVPLKLPIDASMDAASLVVSDANRAAVALIDAWPDWAAPYALIAGPTGAGKSHIAQIWLQKADAKVLDWASLPRSLPDGQNFLLEDVDAGKIDEVSLFHCLNEVRQRRAYILMTARSWPSSWGISTPDLLSRLRAATTLEVSEPDDALLRAVLMKLFSDRQLTVDPGVIDYLSTRMERSVDAAIRLVDRLDDEALARKSRITKALARSILDADNTSQQAI